MKAWAIVLVMVATASAGARSPQPGGDAQIEESIQAALAKPRASDSPQPWRELGPRASQVIERMIAESRHLYRKIRLVTALGNFDTPDVAAYLRDTALSTTNSTMRRAAIRALGRSQGMREEAFLTRALRSRNPHTRLAAAEALQATRDARALALVDSYLRQEKASWVVAKLRKSGS